MTSPLSAENTAWLEMMDEEDAFETGEELYGEDDDVEEDEIEEEIEE